MDDRAKTERPTWNSAIFSASITPRTPGSFFLQFLRSAHRTLCGSKRIRIAQPMTTFRKVKNSETISRPVPGSDSIWFWKGRKAARPKAGGLSVPCFPGRRGHVSSQTDHARTRLGLLFVPTRTRFLEFCSGVFIFWRSPGRARTRIPTDSM